MLICIALGRMRWSLLKCLCVYEFVSRSSIELGTLVRFIIIIIILFQLHANLLGVANLALDVTKGQVTLVGQFCF